MKARKCLLTLAFCLTASSWASEIRDDDRMSAQLALSRKMTETRGKLQNNHDKWWNDFEIGTQKKLENVPAYLNNLANTNPEATAWFLAGAKYGLCNPPMTEQQRVDMRSARDKVAHAEASLIKEGKEGFLRSVHVVFKTGEAVLNDLLNRVDSLEYDNKRLTSRVSFLEKEVAGIPLLLQKEKNERATDVARLTEERRSDVARLNLRIEKLEKENDKLSKKITETDKKSEINSAVEDAIKEFETEKTNLKKEFLKEKKDRETAFEKILSDEKKLYQATIENFKSIVEGYERKALGDAEALQKRAEDAEKAVEEYKKKLAEDKAEREREKKELEDKAEKEKNKLELTNAQKSLQDKIDSYNDLNLNLEFMRTTLGTTNARVAQLEERAKKYEQDILDRQSLLKDLRAKLGDCDNCRAHINSIDKVLIA